MKKPKYPLQQITDIKKRRLEEAEKILKKKREILQQEENTLKEKRNLLNASQKAKLDMIEKHYIKIQEGISTVLMDAHNKYIKEVMNVKIDEDRENVKKQKKVVEKAKIDLDNARKDRLQKNQELEKMHIHKKDWKKQVDKELMIQEGVISDEMGMGIHFRNKKRAK